MREFAVTRQKQFSAAAGLECALTVKDLILL
jgi:hypothetical protein